MSKDIKEPNNTINQQLLCDINRNLCAKMAEHILFSSAYGLITKEDHILGDNAHLNKF